MWVLYISDMFLMCITLCRFLNTSLIITLNQIFGTILKLWGWLVENEHSFLLVCMFTTILVSWFQSKMQLATEAVKFKFDSLNPVNGLKRIFGLKTVKNLLKQFFILFFLHWRSKYFGVIINHCFLKLLMEISYLYYQIGERCYSFSYCIVSAV